MAAAADVFGLEKGLGECVVVVALFFVESVRDTGFRAILAMFVVGKTPSGTDLEIRAGFDREGGARRNGLVAEFLYFVLFAPRILKQSLSLSCSLPGL